MQKMLQQQKQVYFSESDSKLRVNGWCCMEPCQARPGVIECVDILWRWRRCPRDPDEVNMIAGQILDWDTKPKEGAGSDATFSATKYAQLLREDI